MVLRSVTCLIQDTRYKNLYLTSDTFKQITLAIKATCIFRQTYYKANIHQVKISCKRKNILDKPVAERFLLLKC